MLQSVVKSTAPGKKYTAIFSDGSRVHFGGKGCMDYRLYWQRDGQTLAKTKRRAYIARHRAREPWLNAKAPGTLSRILLWQFRTLEEGIRKYERTISEWRKRPWKRYV